MPVQPEVLLVETVLITGGTGRPGRDVVAYGRTGRTTWPQWPKTHGPE